MRVLYIFTNYKVHVTLDQIKFDLNVRGKLPENRSAKIEYLCALKAPGKHIKGINFV